MTGSNVFICALWSGQSFPPISLIDLKYLVHTSLCQLDSPSEVAVQGGGRQWKLPGAPGGGENEPNGAGSRVSTNAAVAHPDLPLIFV